MGQLALIRMFLLVSIPTDINDNRRHIHVFRNGSRHMRSVAKIWMERDGQPCVQIAYSELSARENHYLCEAIERNWAYLDNQITLSFSGKKTKIKRLD